MQVFVVTHIEKNSEGITLESQNVYGDRSNAEANFLTLCKRGLQNEDDFTEEMAEEILNDQHYEDSFNFITLSDSEVI